ncbi:MAG: flagellar motor protein MotB [bacterium]|nr:flagellar motor protein MotB [bacterium]
MFQYHAVIRKLIVILLLLSAIPIVLHAQGIRPQPKWWFGGAAAANFNYYNGTAQILNESVTTPAPFHRGSGVGVYFALGIEYRPHPVWGGMLYVGYDERNGKWNDVVTPCGDKATLQTNLRYFTVEPSLRIAPFSSSFYLFLGPRFAMNKGRESCKLRSPWLFTYTEEGKPDTKCEWSDMRETLFSAEVGAGYDIPLSKITDPTQVVISPFVSFHPYFGQNPRTVENWAVTTIRAGAILKLGHAKVEKVVRAPVVEPPDVVFSVRAPKVVPIKRRVRESFPLRNNVFFEEGSSSLPSRYVVLTKDQASSFKEEQLQEVQPLSMTGRSLRQMTVYYNILNTVGDRMKRNPGSTILLSGASDKGSEHGKARAETIKSYLVDVFAIDGSRITTEGRNKPRIPSEQPGGTKELVLLRAGDSRVDIESNSPELLIQVGGASHYMLKPVQIVDVVEDPLDSHVFFHVIGAKEEFYSWSLEITDEQGRVQPFGPYTRELETIPGNTILGSNSQGNYRVVMVGQAKNGTVNRKESIVSLVRRDEPVKEAVRFSILFDFDKSKTVATYEKFLTEVVTPLIPDSGVVIIHGHTDIIGEDDYNLNLSRERAIEVQRIIKRALSNTGKHQVTFDTLDFGEDVDDAPFENNYPEERFYNRTVIIDIVPVK